MGKIIGIDLGTTYCAVAIPGEINRDGFMPVRGCPGYSVILDRYKARTTPSVVAEDSQGQIIVGMMAKNRAGMSPEPVMFAKRAMGEDKTFKLDKQGELTAVEVSAHILRYLKKMAEDRLGEPVDEAVITVPAYFLTRATQATQKAGELAGLKVSQVAQEPVAAALMYCASDNRDPLRVMTYDLGGGTFDVAVMEKRGGTITSDSVLTFGGDRFLGGYNFDCLIADWLEQELISCTYDLKLDLNKPADKIIRAKLMVCAERMKIRLSEQDAYTFSAEDTGIIDHSGMPVTMEGITLERASLEAMIEKLVDYSIELCHRTLSEANPPISPDSLDEVLMVGGSSKIPMVARKLEAAFGRKPRLVEPDLCVALGAAILASGKSRPFGRFKLDNIPTQTDLPTFSVTGVVLPADPSVAADMTGGSVRLRATDGSYANIRRVSAQGAFAFENVELAAEQTTDFILSGTDCQGLALPEHRFSVRHAAAERERITPEILPVLARPLNILTDKGMHEFAPKLTPLPYKVTIPARTTDTSGKIRIPIYEENYALGEILLTDIPRTLPVGSTVDIEVEVQTDFQILGRAHIKALAKEASVVINIPIPAAKSEDELRADFNKLDARADEAIKNAGPGARMGDARVRRLIELRRELPQLLQSNVVEAAMVQDRLDEMETLTNAIIRGGFRPTPARAIFQAKADEARSLLKKAIQADGQVAQDGYDKQLDAILTEAEKAYQAQNAAAWKSSYDKLAELSDRLEQLAKKEDGGSDGGSGPSAQDYIFSFRRQLTDLEREAKNLGVLDQYKDDFKDLADRLEKIDPQARDAMTQIRDWYFTGYEDLRKRMGSNTGQGLVEVDG